MPTDFDTPEVMVYFVKGNSGWCYKAFTLPEAILGVMRFEVLSKREPSTLMEVIIFAVPGGLPITCEQALSLVVLNEKEGTVMAPPFFMVAKNAIAVPTDLFESFKHLSLSLDAILSLEGVGHGDIADFIPMADLVTMQPPKVN